MRVTTPAFLLLAASCSRLVVALLFLWSIPCSAQHGRIDQLYHTAWTLKNGAPGQISGLAQTSDGYLWLSAAVGLYRFDGVSFERQHSRRSRREA